jgi:hypothetical protein
MKDETPIKVLCKKINLYRSFVERLKTKEGIDKDAAQEKLDKLICEYEEKIKEFEIAITILDPTAKCEPTIVKSSEVFDGNSIEKLLITILSKNQMNIIKLIE